LGARFQTAGGGAIAEFGDRRSQAAAAWPCHDNLHSVNEPYTEDDFRQLLVTVEATPAFSAAVKSSSTQRYGDGSPEERRVLLTTKKSARL
jgi:hypothetical protein